jgi:hypothetical protein
MKLSVPEDLDLIILPSAACTRLLSRIAKKIPLAPESAGAERLKEEWAGEVK